MLGVVSDGHSEAEADPFSWGRVAGLFAPHRGRLFLVVGLVLAVAALGFIT